GRPAQFFHRFQNPLAEENGSFIIVVKEVIFLIEENGFSMKIIIIVNEINLKLCIRNGSYFDNQRFFLVTNRNINPRQTHYLMQSVFSFINQTKTWNENSDFSAKLLHGLWEFSYIICNICDLK